MSPKVNVKQTAGGEHIPGQDNSTSSGLTKREPLLPTPPSTQMVKLDTTLTCKSYRHAKCNALTTEFELRAPVPAITFELLILHV